MKLLSVVFFIAVTADQCRAFSPRISPGFVVAKRGSISYDAVTCSNGQHHGSSKTLLRAAFESVDEVEFDAEERMEKSVSSVVTNLSTIRTGRANAAMLDRVQVEYYGALTPLNQMAGISVPNSQQLQIQPYDKSTLADIERAIIESDLGLTPNNDGDVVRINIPALTEDRRKDMLKQCKALGEDGKVAIRNVRRDSVDSIKKLEKASTISEDQSKDGQEAIQKLTDQYIKEIDTKVASKEKDVMTV